jgi:hypothetical protein
LTTTAGVAATTGAQAELLQKPGTIFGRVLDAVSDEPVSGVLVAILDGRDNYVVTNSAGQFAFFDVTPGNKQFAAIKDGYVEGEFGIRWAGTNQPMTRNLHYPEGQFVPLTPGETRGPIEIRLWKLATIAGRVVDEAGNPIVAARVEAWPRAYAAGNAWLNRVYAGVGLTDDRGSYRIPQLLPGEYAVVFPSPTVTLPSDREVSSQSWAKVDAEVLRALVAYGSGPDNRSGRTAGLTVGDWRLASPRQPLPPTAHDLSTTMGYPTTFYPATTTPDAAALVTVGAGEVRADVDLQLTPIPTHSIYGVLASSEGTVPQTSLVLYQTGASGIADVQTAVAFSRGDGRFAFFGVPSGTYRVEVVDLPVEEAFKDSFRPNELIGSAPGAYLRVVSARSDRPTLWANAQLTVGERDVSDLRMTLQVGTRVTGRVVFESGSGRTSPSKELVLGFERADGRTMSVQNRNEIDVAEDGSFRSVELPGGKYFLRPSRLPAGWSLQSATWHGRDLSVMPFECPAEDVNGVVIVLTDRPTEISGAVATREGRPDPAATVVVFPRDSTTWSDFGVHPRSIALARADTFGRYVASGLPAGDYWIVAVDDTSLSIGLSPQLFGELSRVAAQARVALGDHQHLDLVTQAVR